MSIVRRSALILYDGLEEVVAAANAFDTRRLSNALDKAREAIDPLPSMFSLWRRMSCGIMRPDGLIVHNNAISKAILGGGVGRYIYEYIDESLHDEVRDELRRSGELCIPAIGTHPITVDGQTFDLRWADYPHYEGGKLKYFYGITFKMPKTAVVAIH